MWHRREFTIVFIISASINIGTQAILYPYESQSREVKDLSGRGKFLADLSPDRNQSFRDRWWESPLSDNGVPIDMPVPSSYNDITQDKLLRDFIGWVW